MKTKLLLKITVIIFLTASQGFAQRWEHAERIGGGLEIFSYPNGIVSEGEETVVIFNFSDSISIGGEQFKILGENNDDGLIVKYDIVNSEMKWIKQFGSTGDELLMDVSIDKLSNYYVTGSFSNFFEFANDTIISSGGVNAMILKYDNKGQVVWAEGIENTTRGYDVEYKNGYIYVAGDGGYNSAFISKFDSVGKKIWSQDFSGVEKNLTMQIDDDNNIYLYGQFNGAINIQGTSISDDYSSYLLKLNSQGELIWLDSINSLNYADVRHKLMLNDSKIILASTFDDVRKVNTESYTVDDLDISLEYYDSQTGNFLGYKTIGGIGRHYLADIVFDHNGNYYVSGTGDNYVTIENETYSGTGNAFFIKFNPSDSPEWVHFEPKGGGIGRSKLSISHANQLIFVGEYKGSITLDSISLLNEAAVNYVLAKLNPSAEPYEEEPPVTSVEKKDLAQKIVIFPNPSKSIFYVSLANTNNSQINIYIYNSVGERFSIPVKKMSNSLMSFDLTDYPVGLYHVLLKSNNTSEVKRIIRN